MITTLVLSLLAPFSLSLDPLQEVAPGAPAAAQAAPGTDSPFPAVSGDLKLDVPATGSGPTMLQLAKQYGDLTGQACAWDRETESRLHGQPVGIDRSLVVPRADVQTFFEQLLRKHEFVLRVLRDKQPRIVEIVSAVGPARVTLREGALLLAPGDLEVARAHPAVLFTIPVELRHLDVRQVSNSLRTTIVDANFSSMLPAGSAPAMLITGFGDWVAQTADQLRVLDGLAAPKPDPEREPVLEVFQLKHRAAEQLAPLVESALELLVDVSHPGRPAADAGTPPMPRSHRITFDGKSNALIVACRRSALAEVRKLVAELDVEVK